MKKIKTTKTIARIATRLRKKRKKIVFTNGCFDILHLGHIKYLEKCKHLGDILIVGLNSDSSVRKIKGKKRPIQNEKERSLILSAMECVDYITIFKDPTPSSLIKAVKPHILAKGGDWKPSEIAGGSYVKKQGGRVVSVPFVKGYSTSGIIKRIKKI